MNRIRLVNFERSLLRVTRWIAQYISLTIREVVYIFNYFRIMLFKLAVFVASLAIVLSSTNLSAFIAVPSLFFVYQLLGGWQLTKLIYNTFLRDMKTLFILLKVKSRMRKLVNNKSSIPKLFVKIAAKFPNRKAIQMVNGPSMTFGELEEHSNRVSNLFTKSEQSCLHPQDCVVVYMLNRVEYVSVWLGLSKVGLLPALVNTSLRGQSLLHCIQLSKCKAIVFCDKLAQYIAEIQNDLPADIKLYQCGGDPTMTSSADDGSPKVATGTLSLEAELSKVSPRQPKLYDCEMKDPLLYIYTSGTTGLPKAAIVNHLRFFTYADSTYYQFGIRANDIYYCSLPLYHSNGGILGVGNMLTKGNTIVIREKFSASNLFKDCAKYNCTVIQYIGEVCRYLIAQPENDDIDKGHCVRLAFGNGLRPSIWEKFRSRFNIAMIGEFYGSTEGNVSLVNNNSTPGKVGFVTRLFSFFYPVKLIRVDSETGQPIRDKNGMCIFCGPGEPGVLVGQISKDPIRQYNGYLCKKSTNKSIIRDVFKSGDSAFISGDLLEMDVNGYMTFLDRLGDTFRWRGENVSTLEVETSMQGIKGIEDVAVYGVEIEGIEGKAGMVAVVENQDDLELADFHNVLCKRLPAYARPIFIRMLKDIETTGTFKHKKTDLRKQGFNPNIVKDKLFYLDARKGYLPIDSTVYNDICSGKIRL